MNLSGGEHETFTHSFKHISLSRRKSPRLYVRSVCTSSPHIFIVSSPSIPAPCFKFKLWLSTLHEAGHVCESEEIQMSCARCCYCSNKAIGGRRWRNQIANELCQACCLNTPLCCNIITFSRVHAFLPWINICKS